MESSFLVARLWRGLQLDAVDSTLHSQSLQLGSPGSVLTRPQSIAGEEPVPFSTVLIPATFLR